MMLVSSWPVRCEIGVSEVESKVKLRRRDVSIYYQVELIRSGLHTDSRGTWRSKAGSPLLRVQPVSISQALMG
jgi:hypothetical protein